MQLFGKVAENPEEFNWDGYTISCDLLNSSKLDISSTKFFEKIFSFNLSIQITDCDAYKWKEAFATSETEVTVDRRKIMISTKAMFTNSKMKQFSPKEALCCSIHVILSKVTCFKFDICLVNAQ